MTKINRKLAIYYLIVALIFTIINIFVVVYDYFYTKHYGFQEYTFNFFWDVILGLFFILFNLFNLFILIRSLVLKKFSGLDKNILWLSLSYIVYLIALVFIDSIQLIILTGQLIYVIFLLLKLKREKLK